MVRLLLPLLVAAALFAQPTPDANKELARRYFSEVWIAAKAEKAVDYFAPKYLVADPRGGPGLEQTAQQEVERIRNLCVTNSDCSGSRILSQLAEGDRVATIWMLRARPRTLFASLLAKALGAGQVDRRVITIFRFENGRIAEMIMQRDDVGLYADLGLLNGAVLVLYALGGLSGLAMAWIVARTLRK